MPTEDLAACRVPPSGRNSSARPGLRQALDSVRYSDVLIVWKPDRLGRSLAHLIGTVATLEKHRVSRRPAAASSSICSAQELCRACLGQFERDLSVAVPIRALYVTYPPLALFSCQPTLVINMQTKRNYASLSARRFRSTAKASKSGCRLGMDRVINGANRPLNSSRIVNSMKPSFSGIKV